MTPARRVHAGAAVIIAVFAAFLAAFALRSYFFMDEWYYLRDAQDQGLTWEFLSDDVYGAFAPLFKLAFLPILWSGSRYTSVALVLVAIGAVAAYQLWRLLVLLCGATGRSLVALAACCSTVLWIPSVIWPADGLHVLPATCLGLAVIELHVRSHAAGGRRALDLGAGVCLLLALGLWSKALLLVVYLLLLRVLVLRDGRSPWRDWQAWAPLAGACGLYLGYFLWGGDYGRGTTEPLDLGRAAEVVAAIWTVGFWPALTSVGALAPRLGIPALEPPLLPTPVLSVVAGQAVLFAVVAISAWRRSQALRPWLWLALVVAANAAFVAAGREHLGTAVGREYRYYADLVPLAGLALGLALRGEPARLPALARLPRSAVVVAVVAALVVHAGLAVAAAQRVLERFPEEIGRDYVRNFRASAPSFTGRLLDGGVPGGVMTPLYGDYAMRSSLLALIDDRVVFASAPAPGPLGLVREDGRIVPARLLPVATARRGPGCVAAGSPRRVVLAAAPQDSSGRLLTLRYRGAVRGTRLSVAVGASEGEVEAGANRHDFVPAPGAGTALVALRSQLPVRVVGFELAGGAPLCVDAVSLVEPREVGLRNPSRRLGASP